MRAISLPIFLSSALIGLAGVGGAIAQSPGQDRAAPAEGDGPSDPASAARQRLEAELILWRTLMGTASAIDACTQAYASEFPDASGTVELRSEVMKDGTVGRATARTSLEGARNLRPCLERVAKGWRFPPIAKDGEPLSLQIPVKRGNKFFIAKPGEKDEASAAPSERPEEGFLQLIPEFLPSTWVESPK